MVSVLGKHSIDGGVVAAVSAPTQVEHKWRATVRTVFQVVLALAAIIPLIVPAIGLSSAAGVGAIVLAVAAAITRLMAEPKVNDFIEKFAPWLRAG